MTTLQAIANQAVGGKHLGPGGMTGVFKQRPAVNAPLNILPKSYVPGACGVTVVLQANTTANAVIMARGECGLSGVVCADCAQVVDSFVCCDDDNPAIEDEPGLHMRG